MRLRSESCMHDSAGPRMRGPGPGRMRPGLPEDVLRWISAPEKQLTDEHSEEAEIRL